MKYFFENDLFLEYEFIRAEGKQTLLFLNGLTQSYEVWKNCVSRFQQNYQFILVDLVNQGKSSSINEKKDFDQHAAILKKLVDHLNINEIFVAGISYGSLVAQHFALQFGQSVKGLILISSFAAQTHYYRAIELSWENALAKTGYRGFVTTILPYVLGKTFFEKNNVNAEQIIEDRMKQPVNENSLRLLMLATKERKNYTQELSGLQSRVLILHGEEDILFPTEMAYHLSSAIKNSHLVIFPKTGHSINVEQPELLTREIEKFIEGNL